jgi:hypothetical protein
MPREYFSGMNITADKTSYPNTQNGLPKLLFNREEAAEMLDISCVTLDRLTKEGLLKPNRDTRRPLYPFAELQRFAQSPRNPRS